MADANTVTLITVAFFGLLTGALTAFMPLLMQRQRNSADERIRIVDFERQDQVARLAAEAEITRNRALNEINNKQDIIHLLVNSNLTAAIQAEHDSTSRELVVMLELQDIKRGMGKDPTKDTIGAIEAARARLTDLRANLEKRAVEAKVVEAEQKRQAQQTESEKLKGVGGKPVAPIEVKVVESHVEPIAVVPAETKKP